MQDIPPLVHPKYKLLGFRVHSYPPCPPIKGGRSPSASDSRSKNNRLGIWFRLRLTRGATAPAPPQIDFAEKLHTVGFTFGIPVVLSHQLRMASTSAYPWCCRTSSATDKLPQRTLRLANSGNSAGGTSKNSGLGTPETPPGALRKHAKKGPPLDFDQNRRDPR